MGRCLHLALNGGGHVAPNPLVGSVLVYNERIIGQGWHMKYGQAHAEVNCIASVKPHHRDLIPDSTLYVSLEPCAHQGKTPPCTSTILKEGIRSVVVGTPDPFRDVNGKGIGILREAGVEVIVGVLENECRWQNRRFFTYQEKKRPYIHLKWATTADGFMAGKGPGRLKITNALTDRLVHRWRSEEMGILAGSGTVLADDPSFTTRYGWHPQPFRIVVDPQLRVHDGFRMMNDGLPTIVLNGLKDDEKGAIRWVRMGNTHISTMVDMLYQLGIQSVLVEGGAAILNSFLKEGLWDEAHILTNTRLSVNGGLKSPGKPAGSLKDRFLLGDDQIEFFVNS